MKNKSLLNNIRAVKSHLEDANGRSNEEVNDLLDDLIVEIEGLEVVVDTLQNQMTNI